MYVLSLKIYNLITKRQYLSFIPLTPCSQLCVPKTGYIMAQMCYSCACQYHVINIMQYYLKQLTMCNSCQLMSSMLWYLASYFLCYQLTQLSYDDWENTLYILLWSASNNLYRKYLLIFQHEAVSSITASEDGCPPPKCPRISEVSAGRVVVLSKAFSRYRDTISDTANEQHLSKCGFISFQYMNYYGIWNSPRSTK